MDIEKKMECLIAEMRLEGYETYQIIEVFEEVLDNIVSNKKDG